MGSIDDFLSPINFIKADDIPEVDVETIELFKELNGVLTIFRPSHDNLLKVFEGINPGSIKNDKLIVNNEFITNPYMANSLSNMPEYGSLLSSEVNVTDDTLNLFSKFLNKIRISLEAKIKISRCQKKINCRISKW